MLLMRERDICRPIGCGRSKDWVKVKNRKHPATERVLESFAGWPASS
jgi:hypothetical protein